MRNFIVRKIYNAFSYALTLLMFFVIFQFITINLIKKFIPSINLNSLSIYNIVLLVFNLFISLFIIVRYYTPRTNHLFLKDNH